MSWPTGRMRVPSLFRLGLQLPWCQVWDASLMLGSFDACILTRLFKLCVYLLVGFEENGSSPLCANFVRTLCSFCLCALPKLVIEVKVSADCQLL